MSKINCKLFYHSVSPHLQQLYAGFFSLYKKGLINLEQQFVQTDSFRDSLPQHLKNAQHAHLNVILDNTLRLHYDTHDAVEIDEDALSNCDFYFKRSFSPDYISTLMNHQEKLYPLGLNYLILPDGFDRFAIERAWHLKKSIKDWLVALANSSDTRNIIKYKPRQRLLESLPDVNSSPRVLFLVTAYDPYDNPERSEEKIADRVFINETRAKCIKALKKELGDKFLGGFNHTQFTQLNYKDLLVANNEITCKSNFLNLLKDIPICIATTGLHGSIGWKMAEYVAHSKAIVSEKLKYKVPGNFQEGSNYLAFTTPEECVEQSVKLIQDRQLRKQIMINNARYYQAHLKPDALISNTLLMALLGRKKTQVLSSDFNSQPRANIINLANNR